MALPLPLKEWRREREARRAPAWLDLLPRWFLAAQVELQLGARVLLLLLLLLSLLLLYCRHLLQQPLQPPLLPRLPRVGSASAVDLLLRRRRWLLQNPRLPLLDLERQCCDIWLAFVCGGRERGGLRGGGGGLLPLRPRGGAGSPAGESAEKEGASGCSSVFGKIGRERRRERER